MCYFCFYFRYFSRRCIQKNIAVIMSKSVLLIFSSRSFILCGLMFRSLIHFEGFFFFFSIFFQKQASLIHSIIHRTFIGGCLIFIEM